MDEVLEIIAKYLELMISRPTDVNVNINVLVHDILEVFKSKLL